MMKWKYFFMNHYKDFAIFVGITALSIIISLLCWCLEPTVSRDGVLYLELIQIWHRNGDFQDILDYWPQYWIPPLPLYLMTFLMHCGLSAEAAGVGLNLLAGSMLPLIVYGIAAEVCEDRRIAFYSALLMAVNPGRIELSIEPQRDMIYLFFCGLLIDIFYGYENVVGFYALLYMYIGFFNGFLYKVFYDEDIKVPMLLVGVSDLAYGLVVYGIQFLLRGRLDVFVYLYRIIIPEMVYTVLITVIFYRILFWLNRKLTETEWEGPRLP